MLRKFVEEFVSFVPLQLPRMLDTDMMGKVQYFDDYALLEFTLPSPLDLEEVMNMLEDDIQMILLYHHIPSRSTTFGQSCCAYSNPTFGQMFKINAKTDAPRPTCPDSECLSFGCYEYDNEHTVPHYNLIRLNGLDSIPCGTNSAGMKKLAENAEDEIKAIIQYHLNNSNDGVDNKD